MRAINSSENCVPTHCNVEPSIRKQLEDQIFITALLVFIVDKNAAINLKVI